MEYVQIYIQGWGRLFSPSKEDVKEQEETKIGFQIDDILWAIYLTY